MSRNYLTIDLGTGNTLVSIVNNKSGVIDSVTIKNNYTRDDNYKDSMYFSINEFIDNIDHSISSLLKKNNNISVDGISAAGARQSVVLIDNDGKPIIGLPNIDNRGKEYIQDLINKYDLYEITGRNLTEDFPASKILGYKKVYTKNFERISTFTSLSEWIGYEFTGNLVIEPSQACEMQFFDVNKKEFSQDILNIFGLEQLKFPKLEKAGTSLGKLKKSWTDKYPQLNNAEFIVGGADTQVAINKLELPDDCLVVVSGTTTPIMANSKTAIFDGSKSSWLNCNLRGDGYLVEMNPGITGLNYQNYKDTFLNDIDYEKLEKEYNKITDIKVVSSLTSIKNMSEVSKKTGVFMLKTPLDKGLTIYDFAWSILADMACSISTNIKKLEKIVGISYCKIIGFGNGFKSSTLCQMISDLSNKQIILSRNFGDATTYGLAKICDQYFGEKINIDSKEVTIYNPNDDSIIYEYYNKWSQSNIYI